MNRDHVDHQSGALTTRPRCRQINNILYFKSVSQYPPTSPEVVGKEFRSYLNQWDLLSVENGVLYKYWYEQDSDCESQVIVAPKQLRRELFHHLHELRTGGHLGIKRAVYKLQRRFYWLSLQSDVFAPGADGVLFVRNENLLMGGIVDCSNNL